MAPTIVADVDVATAEVLTVKVADVAPAAIVTLVGTVALVLLDDRETTRPPVGAGVLTVTVPVEGLPPTTEVGETVRLESVGGVIVNVALTEFPESVPVTVADVEVVTVDVVAVKVAEVAPAATVTLAGTFALALLQLSATIEPPVGAGPLRLTVPVEEFPPITVDGEKEMDEAVNRLMLRLALTVMPL